MNLARVDINDTSTVRNAEANVLAFANDGIAKAYVIRPDLKYGSFGTAYVDLVATSSFPLPLEYRPAIANYIVMRCEVSDDPFAVEQRAIQALKLYLSDLGIG